MKKVIKTEYGTVITIYRINFNVFFSAIKNFIFRVYIFLSYLKIARSLPGLKQYYYCYPLIFPLRYRVKQKPVIKRKKRKPRSSKYAVK